jgi:hypothetical protein
MISKVKVKGVFVEPVAEPFSNDGSLSVGWGHRLDERRGFGDTALGGSCRCENGAGVVAGSHGRHLCRALANMFSNFGNVVDFEGRCVCKSWGWIDIPLILAWELVRGGE